MGENIQETRLVSSFNCLKINSLMDVYWHLDTVNKVVIYSGKNMMAHIKTEVKDNKLIITNENKCNWLRRYQRIKVHVYSRAFKYIELYGSGDFYMEDTLYSDSIMVNNWSDISKVKLLVHCNTFSYSQNAGTGDTYIYGRAGVSYLWVMGYGYVFANNFKTGYNYITHKSTGQLYVNVEKEVGARLFSLGNLYVYGRPYKIEKEIYSSGNVIIVE
ncbi:MAG: GIN domain-containing protein [Bacteroidales bacterium]